MSDKKKYFKLGEKAASYYEAVSRLSIVPGKVSSIDASAMNAQIRKSVSDGHIVEVSEKEFTESGGKEIKKAVSEEDTLKGSNAADKQIGMTSGKDAAGKSVKADEDEDEDSDDEEDEDEEDQDEDNDSEDDEDEDEDEVEVTKEDKIKFLTESPLIKDSEKKGLGKLSGPKLNALYNKIKGN